ncbi:hypothetical protein J5N58_06785 [Rhizobium cremeum]|uniref:hypothetical protein n=1 Tax=Rhizobium cremeum TaxID=2813827 RepID=UPI001FD3B010|nr:hypothetical protein [Rhizobium cremeum]MCJ7996656.1 hypothetical protein [Rhizobium cremeum]MCJ7999380.1 hypothetical protein [Rhizobium cremeum]
MADPCTNIVLAFSAHDVTLPLRRCAECSATLVDADGRDILTIDVNAARPDSDVEAIALLLMNIVNSSADLPIGAEQAPTERTT